MTTVFVQASDDWGSGWGLSREADAVCSAHLAVIISVLADPMAAKCQLAI